MRIINLRDLVSKDIEPPLLKMSHSENRLEAFKGQKLLELVRHLKAQGPAHTVCGRLYRGELRLTPLNVAERVQVKVWMDWFDFGPMQDGLPVAHYRMQIKRGTNPLSCDARATYVPEAGEVIREAFGWSA